MIKTYKYILYSLLIIALIIFLQIIIKYIKMEENEQQAKETIAEIQNLIDDNNEVAFKIDTEIDGNKVIGIIRIPTINIEYPILETTNSDTLKLSVTKFWGNSINEIGNIALSGHNNLNGTMFGKVKQLKYGDIIELTNMKNAILEYEIYKIYTINPDDISCLLPEQSNTREVTLITCTNGNKNRLIVKARERINR